MALNPLGEADPRLQDPALRALLEDPARLAFWQVATGGAAAGDPALERQLAQDILALMGWSTAEELQRLRAPMLARAASALCAMAEAGAERGAAARGPGDGQVIVQKREIPWRGFFEMEVTTVSHRMFSGAMSPPVRREVFVMADAVTVLPYDPVSDLVLLVEQYRAGVLGRGAARPWTLEAVAGRIDGGETPETAARREAVEEAGLALTELLPVAGFYPSPGAVTEFIHAFVGLAEISGTAQEGLHGVEEEGEDIRSHILPFETALAMISEGRIQTAPLVMSLLWLQRERPALRARVGRGVGAGQGAGHD